jgi:hypothetical protein
MKRFLCAVTFAALAVTPVLADANGDLWKVTTQMSMEGMPAGMGMGAQTRQVCTAHEWTKPPVGSDDRGCKTTDFARNGNKSTWKISCPDGMSGSGEITRSSPDAYSGWMKMTMSGMGTMTMNLSGERVGDCNAAEAKAERDAQVTRIQGQVAAGQQAAANAQDQSCMSVAEAGDLQMLTVQMQAGMCTDPKYKAKFCESLKKCPVYKNLVEREKSQPEYGLSAVAKYCGVDAAALITVCCDEPATYQNLEFLSKNCPAQAKAAAMEKCAGMGYSALQGEPWLSFCTTYAKEVMGKGAAAPAPKKKTGKSSH